MRFLYYTLFFGFFNRIKDKKSENSKNNNTAGCSLCIGQDRNLKHTVIFDISGTNREFDITHTVKEKSAAGIAIYSVPWYT